MEKVVIFAAGIVAAPVIAGAAKFVHKSTFGPVVEVAVGYTAVMAAIASTVPAGPAMTWAEYWLNFS
jgi:hypothetical protein